MRMLDWEAKKTEGGEDTDGTETVTDDYLICEDTVVKIT